MSPLTSCFESGQLVYKNHLNMVSLGLEPNYHQSSLMMDLTCLDHAPILLSSATSLPYHLPIPLISSTSSLEDDINSELVLMEIYEFYG